MTEHASFHELFGPARASLPYKVERKIIDFTEQVIGRIETLDLSRTDFATKLDASPAYVTKLLRGGTNFTLESMVKVSDALGCDLEINMVPKTAIEGWVKVIDKKYPISRPEVQVWQMNDFTASPRENMLSFVGTTQDNNVPQLIFRDEHPTPSTW